MEHLRRYNVRGFVTFNTLVFTDELRDAEQILIRLAEAGVDAIIVQDPGLARLAREVAPKLELHASTQMTITSPEGLELAKELGITRAVLAREISLRELNGFRRRSFQVEVFVHGALCVAYSGQCLTSESLGQRSANRGECAQACRLPYQLLVDGQPKELGEKRYLLSPQDLAGIEEIPELMRLGVASFKIEGRLKSPEYVAAVTRVYRDAIDRAIDALNPKIRRPRVFRTGFVQSGNDFFTGVVFRVAEWSQPSTTGQRAMRQEAGGLDRIHPENRPGFCGARCAGGGQTRGRCCF